MFYKLVMVKLSKKNKIKLENFKSYYCAFCRFIILIFVYFRAEMALYFFAGLSAAYEKNLNKLSTIIHSRSSIELEDEYRDAVNGLEAGACVSSFF